MKNTLLLLTFILLFCMVGKAQDTSVYKSFHEDAKGSFFYPQHKKIHQANPQGTSKYKFGYIQGHGPYEIYPADSNHWSHSVCVEVRDQYGTLVYSRWDKSPIDTLRHKYYTCIYDENWEAPIYSYYILTKAHLKQVTARSPQFFTYPLVKHQATNKTYTHNGKYDKGHLSPDDDFRFDTTAEHEAMYYTNVAPQISSFNRTTWKALETHVRKLCDQYDSIHVWTGCIYSDSTLNGVAIPSYYWKVIEFNNGVNEIKDEFLGKNVPDNNTDYMSIMAKDETIEAMTGIKFY